jgi:hypothetical protein
MVGNLDRIIYKGFVRKLSLSKEGTILRSEFRDRRKDDGNWSGKQLLACEKDK